MSRSIYLDMNYPSMWSLLDEVETQELKEEAPRLEERARQLGRDISELENTRRSINARLKVIRETIDRRYEKDLRDNFELTDDHIKLLDRVYWDSQYPFANIYVDEVVETLGWEKPNDEPSHEQVERAKRLLRELPIAAQHIIKSNLSQ